MADTYPHQNPLTGPLSFRHMYNVEYRPGEDELINYQAKRRKATEAFEPNPCHCGDECECGPGCGCGPECTCCGSYGSYIKSNTESTKIMRFKQFIG